MICFVVLSHHIQYVLKFEIAVFLYGYSVQMLAEWCTVKEPTNFISFYVGILHIAIIWFWNFLITLLKGELLSKN